MTLHRRRKRLGLRPVTVIVSEGEIDFLLAWQAFTFFGRGSSRPPDPGFALLKGPMRRRSSRSALVVRRIWAER